MTRGHSATPQSKEEYVSGIVFFTEHDGTIYDDIYDHLDFTAIINNRRCN